MESTSRGLSSDPMHDYLEEINRISLLTAEQEVDLSKQIEAGLLAEQCLAYREAVSEGRQDEFLAEFMQGPYRASLKAQKYKQKLPEDVRVQKQAEANRYANREARQLVEFATSDISDDELSWLAEDGHQAKQIFIESNLRLAVNTAQKYGWSNLSLLDRIQEANTGLIRAVEKFDFKTGFKFSTYGTWWLKQSVSRAIADTGRAVRLPNKVFEEVAKVKATRRELNKLLGYEPDIQEIALELDMEPDYVKNLLEWSQEIVSLDAPLGHDDDSYNLMDTIAEETEPGPDQLIEKSDNMRVLGQALDLISNQRAAEVVRCRYLLGENKIKLKDVAKHLARLDAGEGRKGRALSVERIRQLEREGLQEAQNYIEQNADGTLSLSEAALQLQQERKAAAQQLMETEAAKSRKLTVVKAPDYSHLEKFLDDCQAGANRRGRILTKNLAEQVRLHLSVNGNAEILEELEQKQATAFAKYLGGQPVKKIAEELESSQRDTAEMVRLAATLVCQNMQATA